MSDSGKRDTSTQFAQTTCSPTRHAPHSSGRSSRSGSDGISRSTRRRSVTWCLPSTRRWPTRPSSPTATVDRPGAMHLRADYDGGTSVLTVTVTDEGAWRIADSEKKSHSRGRGIPLMRALADRATIDSSAAGTQGAPGMESRRRGATASAQGSAAAPPERRTRRSAGPRS